MCRGGRVDAGERATDMMELVTGVEGVGRRASSLSYAIREQGD